MPMNRRVAFFNVDTQQPSEDRSGLVYRSRVQHLADKIDALLEFAEHRDIFVLSTVCVNAGPVQHVLESSTLFVPIEVEPGAWQRTLPDCRGAYLEKRTCGSPKENVRLRAYDVFHSNPNAAELVRCLGIEHWVVFGDSARYCFRSTVEGLLALGCQVTALTDVVGKGIDSEDDKVALLQELEHKGARLAHARELLDGLT